MINKEGSLLLILPVFLIRRDNFLWLDDQACNGLRLWLENFKTVTVAAVLNPDIQKIDGYRSIDSIINSHRLEIIPLPYSYTPKTFLRDYRKTINLIDALINNHRYLSFAIGGYWGDWGSYAGLRASRKKRSFSVWTDRVESNIILLTSRKNKGIKKSYYFVLSKLSQFLNNHVIKKADLGLFHGSDCYNAYSSLTDNSFCVHDIHLSEEYHIPIDELEQKISCVDSDRPFKIFYAGRVDSMKGPEDWLEIMKNLIHRGFFIEAIWAGEGELREELNKKIVQYGIEDQVQFIGMVSSRDDLLSMMKESDAFVFCHKTLESPRCLIESLISGCPIVGYKSDYPVDLVSQHGGGVFVSRDDIPELTKSLTEMIKDNNLRKKLIKEAAESGKLYSDAKVFEHRSNLIKKYL